MNKNRFHSYVNWPVFAIFLFASSLAAAKGLPNFTELAKNNSPAVVNISTTQHAKIQKGLPKNFSIPDLPEDSPFNDLFKHFFGEGLGDLIERDTESLGSGFIISEDGYILTAHHVVEDADEIIVRLSDRKSYEAKLIGSDKGSDVALLKIEAQGLPKLTLGESNKLEVGEWVLAIGSPFGFDHTVTAGIVSAIGRSLPSENYVPFIQTDVAINPGNSGGPLFNLKGEVVGINSQIYSRTGGFMGLSFAIPIELALNVADQLKEKGHVSRGYLGVLIQDVDRSLADSFGLSHPRGALISRVLPDSPAEKAGLEIGDIILEFNGNRLLKSSQLPPLVGTTSVNKDATLKILRKGKEKEIKIRIGELPGEEDVQQEPARAIPTESDPLGLSVQDLTDQQRKKLGISKEGGVLITDVKQGPAMLAGIQKGDVILLLGGKEVSSAAGYNELIKELKAGQTVAVLVQKAKGPVFLAMRIPE